MNPLVRLWLLCAGSVLALSACGGGGDDAVTADESGLAPSSTCLPTIDVLTQRVKGGDTYVTTARNMGCEGRLVSDVALSGQAIRTYDWGRVESGPYVQMEFRNDNLRVWSSKGLFGAEPSACLPTRAAVDRLTVGAGIRDTETILGCRGHTVSLTFDYGATDGAQHVVAWGNITSGPYLMVTFRNSLVVAFASQRL